MFWLELVWRIFYELITLGSCFAVFGILYIEFDAEYGVKAIKAKSKRRIKRRLRKWREGFLKISRRYLT